MRASTELQLDAARARVACDRRAGSPRAVQRHLDELARSAAQLAGAVAGVRAAAERAGVGTPLAVALEQLLLPAATAVRRDLARAGYLIEDPTYYGIAGRASAPAGLGESCSAARPKGTDRAEPTPATPQGRLPAPTHVELGQQEPAPSCEEGR